MSAWWAKVHRKEAGSCGGCEGSDDALVVHQTALTASEDIQNIHASSHPLAWKQENSERNAGENREQIQSQGGQRHLAGKPFCCLLLKT